MFQHKTPRILALVLLLSSFILPPDVLGGGVEKRVVFPKGKTSITYRGKVPFNGDRDSYVVRAAKGKTLSVKLISDDAEAFIAIYETKVLGPDEDTVLGYDKKASDWAGKVPVTGEYDVQVHDTSENGINRAAYSIQISVK
jgi:hypothetical protein